MVFFSPGYVLDTLLDTSFLIVQKGSAVRLCLIGAVHITLKLAHSEDSTHSMIVTYSTVQITHSDLNATLELHLKTDQNTLYTHTHILVRLPEDLLHTSDHQRVQGKL